MDAQVANGGSWRTVNIAMFIVTAPIVPSQKSISEDPENGNYDLLRIFAQLSYKSHFLTKTKEKIPSSLQASSLHISIKYSAWSFPPNAFFL
jgi:hypothetical protein